MTKSRARFATFALSLSRPPRCHTKSIASREITESRRARVMCIATTLDAGDEQLPRPRSERVPSGRSLCLEVMFEHLASLECSFLGPCVRACTYRRTTAATVARSLARRKGRPRSRREPRRSTRATTPCTIARATATCSARSLNTTKPAKNCVNAEPYRMRDRRQTAARTERGFS